ncbi:peptidyl-prolyl cis-trans isomerase [Deltaproteobacteria bacterium]|nr:peptidyl-prolyl cis-trans isomerase [Deltaproteobacteria bacterium]
MNPNEPIDTPAPAVQIPGAGPLRVVIHTTLGEVECELFEAEAPRTVANFVGLALGSFAWTDPKGRHEQKALYPGTLFHRVIPDFMIQGGCPEGTGRGTAGYRWKDEPGALRLRHDQPGTLSMANSGAPHSQGCQFFITDVPTPHLDGKHGVFGRVVRGMDVVSRIARVPASQNRPLTPVKIVQMSVFRG